VIAITIDARQQTTMIPIVIDQTAGTSRHATGRAERAAAQFSSGSSGVGASMPDTSDLGLAEYQSR
jgi:hypothetical protein